MDRAPGGLSGPYLPGLHIPMTGLGWLHNSKVFGNSAIKVFIDIKED